MILNFVFLIYLRDQVFISNVFFIELIQKDQPNIVIFCVYRSPDSDVSRFNSVIEGILDAINAKKRMLVLIAGDYNLDLIKAVSDEPTNEFFSTMKFFFNILHSSYS